jgi:hypothetical protein
MDDPLAYVVKKLKAKPRDDWPAIAAASGVPLGTLKKVGSGATGDPRISTVMYLAFYFRTGRKHPDLAADDAAALAAS